jgi:hypothetical protein
MEGNPTAEKQNALLPDVISQFCMYCKVLNEKIFRKA